MMKIQRHVRRFGCLLGAVLTVAGTISVAEQDDKSADPIKMDAEQVQDALLERFDENWNKKLDTSELDAARHRLKDILDATDLTEMTASDWRDDLQSVFDIFDVNGDTVLDTTEISQAKGILDQLLNKNRPESDTVEKESEPSETEQKPKHSVRSSRKSSRGQRGTPATSNSPFGFSPFLGGGNSGTGTGASAGSGLGGSSLGSDFGGGFTGANGSGGSGSEGFASEMGDTGTTNLDGGMFDSQGDEQAGDKMAEEAGNSGDMKDGEPLQDPGGKQMKKTEDGVPRDDLSESVDNLGEEESIDDTSDDNTDDGGKGKGAETGKKTRIRTNEKPNF